MKKITRKGQLIVGPLIIGAGAILAVLLGGSGAIGLLVTVIQNAKLIAIILAMIIGLFVIRALFPKR